MNEFTKYYLSKYGKEIDYIDLDDNEIVHFKYVKKEKVGGKTRYYYDSASAKKDAKKAVDNVKKSVKKTVDKVKDKVGVDELKKLNDAKRDKRVIDNMTSSSREEIKFDNEYGLANHARKERGKLDKYYKEDHREASAKVREADREFMKTPLGKVYNVNRTVKRKVEAAKKTLDKENIKDKLGYDERANLGKARRDLDRAKDHLDESRERVDRSHRVQKHLKDKDWGRQGIEDANRAMNYYYENWKEAATAERAAQRAYAKTPLGKLDAQVEKGKKKLQKLFSKKKKKK